MSDRTVWQRVRDEKGVVLEAFAHLRFLRTVGELPQGDGHTVVVCPAYSVGDRGTWPMRRFLDRLGYRTVGWGQGTNRGVNDAAVAQLRDLVGRLADESDAPVSMVGWSLGGVFARIVARRDPEHVRRIITLGSPYRRAEAEHGVGPPPVTTVSVFSKGDALVDWRNASEPDDHLRTSIEVRGTHSGLALNPQVLRVVADQLRLPAMTGV